MKSNIFALFAALVFCVIAPCSIAESIQVTKNTGSKKANTAAQKKVAAAQKAAEERAKQYEIKVVNEPQMPVEDLKNLGMGHADIAYTSLYEMGFTQGNTFEGASSEHEFTVYFPMTWDTIPKSGIIKFRFKTSALPNAVSSYRVEVNDHMVYSSKLSQEATLSGLDIPISPGDLKIGYIKLTVRASIMPDDLRCFDEHVYALHYFQVLPETRLELGGLDYNVSSVRGVWSLLPKEVTIAIPQDPSANIMRVILQASTHLHKSGRILNFVRLPAMGQVAIAERADLVKWLASTPGAPKDVLKDGANLAVVHREARGLPNIIVLTEAATDRDMQLLARDWRKVTLAGEYIEVTPSSVDDRKNRIFPVTEMGMNDAPRNILRTAEWRFFAGLPQVPGDMRIKALHLNVVAPPSKDRNNERLLLFVYVNGVLQEVQPVEDTGKTQKFKFTVANYSQWVGRNYIKIVAQRFAPRDCLNSLASYQMQITRDSTIEFEHFDVIPAIFNDLHPYYARGFDLFIDRRYFTVDHLNLLTTVLSNQKYDLSNFKVIEYDGSTPFNPTGPFMIYGRPKIVLDDMTVRFDRGPIEVQTDDKHALLSVQKLPGISIAQVVRHHKFGGMWLSPTEDNVFSGVKEYFLEQGDTSFADPEGEVLNMKTRQMNRAKVAYPEFLDFFGKLGRYRFWLVAIGWMMLGLVIVLAYRRMQQSQKNKK